MTERSASRKSPAVPRPVSVSLSPAAFSEPVMPGRSANASTSLGSKPAVISTVAPKMSSLDSVIVRSGSIEAGSPSTYAFVADVVSTVGVPSTRDS